MREAREVAKVRAAEARLMAALPDGTLMQRAATGLAAVCGQLLGRRYGARVVVLAGSGDNGGDALYAAAQLARRGTAVLAVAAGSRIHDGGAAALRAAGGRITGPDDAAVAAVDLPSGVDADTGVVDGAAVRADVTVTFGTWKPGLLIDPGASYAGVTELIDIGLVPDPPDVVSAQSADIAALLPSPTADSDKYRRGV